MKNALNMYLKGLAERKILKKAKSLHLLNKRSN